MNSLTLYHCTNTKALPKILRQGLRPMKRGYVCLSEDRGYAVLNGFAYFEPQADYLHRHKYRFGKKWNECWLEAIGGKKKAIIEIELPFEMLAADSQQAYRRAQGRLVKLAEAHPDLVANFKMQELHAVCILPRFFVGVEIVQGT